MKKFRYSFIPIFVYSFLLLVVVISISFLAAVPPVSRDALTQHLAVPKLYLAHGGMYEIPSMIVSYYPMNLDLLYLIPLYFHNDILPKFLHFLFALLTSALIFQYLKKRMDTKHGLLGALIFLSTPIVVRLSSEAYVDLGLIFFSFASIYYLLRWIENNFELKWIILSGCCCGLALGTKYNALILFFLLTCFIAFIYSRLNRDKKKLFFSIAGFSSIFALTSLLVFSPWMIRNYIWTQNPIYPLFNHIINPGHPLPDTYISHYNLFQIRHALYGESAIEVLMLPVRIFFQGIDDNPRYFDGKLNPFLLILPFLAFLKYSEESKKIRIEKKIFAYFSFLFLMFVVFQRDMRIRYLGPVIPVLAILSVMGVYQVEGFVYRALKNNVLNRTLITMMLIILLAFNGIYIYSRFHHVQPFGYIFGNVSRDDYIKNFIPEYPVMKYVNKNLTDHDKILAVYIGNRSYYCDRPIIFDINLLKNITVESSTAGDVLYQLKKQNFTYLLINNNLFNYWANQYDDHEKTILKSFFESFVDSVFFKNGCVLYKLGDTHNLLRIQNKTQ